MWNLLRKGTNEIIYKQVVTYVEKNMDRLKGCKKL